MQDEKNAALEKMAALKEIREQFIGNAGQRQCERLLAALQRFPISTFEASRQLDVYHAPARVLQLRKQGHKIITLRQRVETEAGVSHRVGLYILQRGGGHD